MKRWTLCVLAAGLAACSGSKQAGSGSSSGSSGTSASSGSSGSSGSTGGILPAGIFGAGYAMVKHGDGVVVAGIGADPSTTRRNDFLITELDGSLHLVPSFGTNGFTLTDFGGTTDPASGLENRTDDAFAIVADGTGYVVAGSARGQSMINDPAGLLALTRYTAEGQPDLTFGTNGKGQWLGSFSGATLVDHPAAFNSLTRLPDGSFVAVGWITQGSAAEDMVALHFSSSGQPDAAFHLAGATGPVPYHFGNESQPNAIFQQGTKLVIGGGPGFLLTRLDATGAVDASFGNGGTFTVADGQSEVVLMRPTGELVQVGQRATGPNPSDPVNVKVVQTTADGVLDARFGTNGVVEFPASTATNIFRGGALLPDGSILLYGATGGGGALFKLTPSGTLDTTFGQQGKKSLDLPSSAGLFGAENSANHLLLDGNSVWVAEQAEYRDAAGNVQPPRFAVVHVNL